MKGLDLRKFKKVLVEKDATHLEHPSGHKIIISHKLMSPDMKRQLDSLKMYDGGLVTKKPVVDAIRTAAGGQAIKDPQDEQPVPHYTPEEEAKRAAIRKSYGYAEGGQVPTPVQSAEASMRKAFHFADGGSPVVGEEQVVPASQLESNYTAENAIAQGQQPQQAEGQAWADQIGNEIPNEDPTAPMAVDASHAHLSEALKNLSSKFVQSAPAPIQAQQPTPTSVDPQPQQGMPQEAAPQQVMDPGKPQGGFVSQNNQDVALENQAQQASAQNTQQSLNKTADIQGQEAQGMQELHQKYQQIGDQIHQKYEDLASQVEKGHVDPQQWWNKQSTGSQVATAIGMLFAGAAGGAGGHPEMAANAINTAIDRDIDSQKADLNNKQSLLGKYMEMYNSLPQAEAAARLTMHAATEGMVAQQAAKLGSQNAMNAATIFAAGNRRQALGQADNLAKGQAMSQMYNQMGQKGSAPSGSEAAHQKQLQDLAILNPERYKIEEAKYLPGVGIAAKPVPEKIVDELTARKDLSEKIAELELFARKNGSSLDPKTINQGAALARNVQDAYRRGNAQGVFKESEKDFVEKSISSNPTSFFSKIRNLPGYQTVRKLNDDTIKHYQKSYGVKEFKSEGSNQNQAAMEWLKANPNDPRAAAVKAKLGM